MLRVHQLAHWFINFSTVRTWIEVGFFLCFLFYTFKTFSKHAQRGSRYALHDVIYSLGNKYQLKVNNRNTRMRSEIMFKVYNKGIRTTSLLCIVFMSTDVVLVFLLLLLSLTLNRLIVCWTVLSFWYEK